MDEGVRLLILDISWPPETFLRRKIEALAACGYLITVATADTPQGTVPRGVKVVTLPGSRRGWWRAAGLVVLALMRDARQAVRGMSEAASGGMPAWRLAVRRWAIAAQRPQIVHWEWTLSAVPCLPLLEEKRPWHAVVSCRGSQVAIAPHNPRRAKETGRLREVFARCSKVHGVSEATVREAAKLGLEVEKAEVIRPAVDPAQFSGGPKDANSGKVRLVITGALIWCKAVEHALAAFRRAVDQGADLELEVIGWAGKEERARFLYTVEDLELGQRVMWRGALGEDGVAERLREADIFFHASHSEGISNAVLEAMASGLPVVCTDAGGMREAVRDGIDGFVVPVRDVEAMAEALVKLARDPELRRRMGEAARQRVLGEFTLERQTRQWRELYEGLLQECRH
ncbi:MAG: glycosyltransferase family 4 protein [Acidobacteriota bacterium]